VTAADAVAAGFAKVPNVRVLTGRYGSTDADGTVLVDFGQGLVAVYSIGLYNPMPGEFVWCLVVDATTLMMGPVKSRPTFGKVVATGTPNLSVQLADGSTVPLPALSSYTDPAVNDEVTIFSGIVLGDQASTPQSTYVPPDKVDAGGSAARQKTLVFRAVSSGTQNGSGDTGTGNFWSDDVWCGASTIGSWFYGKQIADSIPDNAVIDQVQLYVKETVNSFPGSLATIGTHTSQSKSGSVTVSGSATIARGTGWRDLPLSYGDLLKTGAAYGVGTRHGGKHVFAGRRSTAQSGQLRITFTV